MRARPLVFVVALVACAEGERRSVGVASTSSSSGAAIAPERPASGGAPPPEVATPAPLASASRLTASHASCSCTEEPPPRCTCGVVHYRTDSPHTDALSAARAVLVASNVDRAAIDEIVGDLTAIRASLRSRSR